MLNRFCVFLCASVSLWLIFSVTPFCAAEEMQKAVYAVSVNGEAVSDGTVFLSFPPHPQGEGRGEGGVNLYASSEDLKSWRIKIPPAEGTTYDGRTYYPLSSLYGLKADIDAPNQAVSLTVPPALFETTVVDSRPSKRLKPSTETGLFLNYDLSDEGGDNRVNRLDGLFEAWFFSRYGVLLGTLSEQKIGKDENKAIRLETTWQYDDVDRCWSYRAGDSISRSGAMGRSVRFGGIQWARNFGVEPGFITYPTIETIGGLAELPSSLDAYINNVRSLSKDLPPGPFELYNIPVVTGQGDLRIVVKDLLGREHIITQSYYLSPLLLKKGLSDFSFEAGWERLHYSTVSDDYDRFMAIGTHRYGITDSLTGELHVEYLSEQQMGSLTLVKLIPSIGVFTAGVAGSSSDAGEGGQGFLAYEYTNRAFNLGGSYRASSSDFLELGTTGASQEYQAQARIGTSLGRFGGMGISYTEQKEYGQDKTRILTGNYSVSVGPGQLVLTGFRDMDATDTYGGSAMYIVQLENRKTLVASANMQSNHSRDGVEIQQSIPPSNMGYAWRLRGEKDDEGFEQYQGSLTRQGETNTATVEATRQNEVDSYRAGLSGGFALLKQGVFASRRINQSLGLADVKVPGVTVYADNQEIGKTGNDGYLLIPSLRAYEENVVTLDAEELPFDAELVGEAKETAVPYYRSGVLIPFNVKMSKSVIVTVKTPDGKPLPAGAVVKGANGSEWPVAKEGLVYLTGLAEGENSLTAVVGEKIYKFTVKPASTMGDIQRLGTIVAVEAGIKLFTVH